MNRKLCTLIAAGLIVGLSLFVVGCEMCCNSSKGAGSMIITDPDNTSLTHKATFSYRVECVGTYLDDDPSAVRKISGHLEYHDHGLWTNKDTKQQYSVGLHAVIDNVVNTKEVGGVLAASILKKDGAYDFLPVVKNFKNPAETEIYCSKTAPFLAIFRGHYTPQPKELDPEGGTVTVMVVDKGKPGASSEDRFEISIDSGVFKGYRMKGVLAGGNIKAL